MMKPTLFLAVLLGLLVVAVESCSDNRKLVNCKRIKKQRRCGQEEGQNGCQKTCGYCTAAPVEDAPVEHAPVIKSEPEKE